MSSGLIGGERQLSMRILFRNRRPKKEHVPIRVSFSVIGTTGNVQHLLLPAIAELQRVSLLSRSCLVLVSGIWMWMFGERSTAPATFTPHHSTSHCNSDFFFLTHIHRHGADDSITWIQPYGVKSMNTASANREKSKDSYLQIGSG